MQNKWKSLGLEPQSVRLPLWAFDVRVMDGFGCQKAVYIPEDLMDQGVEPHFTIHWRHLIDSRESDWGEECVVMEYGNTPRSGTLTVYPSLPEALRQTLKGDPYGEEVWERIALLEEMSEADVRLLRNALAFLLEDGWPD